jgi:hypothetical protein
LTLQLAEEIGNIHPIDAVITEVVGAVPTVVMTVEEVAIAGE